MEQKPITTTMELVSHLLKNPQDRLTPENSTYNDVRAIDPDTTIKITALRCVALAKRNTSFEGSSRVCLNDALYLLDQGDFRYAAHRALKSLAHSVGLGHADYAKADKLAERIA